MVITMKTSFSTLGCPNWPLAEILSTAKDLGYDGIELRGLGEDICLPNSRIFQSSNAENVKAELKRKGLYITCISTECELQKKNPEIIPQARAYIDLAEKFGSPYIRLLGDTNPWPGENVDAALVEKNLKSLIPYAEKAGVTLLIESNGVFSNTALLKELLDKIASPFAAALWDINHPVRYGSETPAETYGNIGTYVRHVHVKDSKPENGKLAYKMLGYGDLPLREAFSILKSNGYDGCISLEWTKRWNTELEEPGIVFSHFIYAVKKMWNEA